MATPGLTLPEGEQENRSVADRIPQTQQIVQESEEQKQQRLAAEAAAAQAEQQRILNNHYEYGDVAGQASEQAQYFRRQAEAAQQRPGEAIDYRSANNWENENVNDRTAQLNIAEMMRRRAAGQVPSIAAMRAGIDINRAVADQTSIGAGARGPAGLALASQVAAANSANAISSISNTAQVNSAQERLDAERAALGAYSTVRGGDTQSQEQAAKQAQAQAAINAAQRQANDAYSSGLYGQEAGINRAQLDAQMHQIDTAAGIQTADKNRSSAESMHDQDRTDKYIAIGGGIAAGVGGAVLGNFLGGGKDKPVAGANSSGSSGSGSAPADGSLTPGTSAGTDGNGTYDPYKADGGPVRAGRPYIVGERGPELIVPRADGHVLTAEETHPLLQGEHVRDLGEIDEPRDLGEIDEPVRDMGEIDTYREPVSFERHNSPAMDRRIADMFAAQKAQDTMLGESATSRAMARADRHPLLQGDEPSRVDDFLDRIHPLSYHYKDASQEPRSTPTGGRYLGISAQDLKSVPEVGPQMVSKGPRGEQIEAGPTLSAALAGEARLNERLRALEAHPLLRDGRNARSAPDVITSDIRAKTGIVSEGMAGAPTASASMPHALPPNPIIPPNPVTPAPGASYAIPPNPVTPASWASGTLPGPQRAAVANRYAFTSDITAKEDVVSEGEHPLSGPRGSVGESAGGRAASTTVERPVRAMQSFTRERPESHPLAADVGTVTSSFASAPPVPGSTMSPTDMVKSVQAAGQAVDTAARGYSAAKPAVVAAKRRVEGAIDETARRGADVYRAATGNANRGPTLADVYEAQREAEQRAAVQQAAQAAARSRAQGGR